MIVIDGLSHSHSMTMVIRLFTIYCYMLIYIFLLITNLQVCHFCTASFTKNTNKYRHIRREHGDSIRKFQCLLCFALLSTPSSHRLHAMRKHAGEVISRVIWLGIYFLEEYPLNFYYNLGIFSSFPTENHRQPGELLHLEIEPAADHHQPILG